MFKRKIFITTIITILSLIFFSGSINAVEIEKGNYSKRYEEWLKLSDEEKENTIAPLPFNIKNEKKSSFSILKNVLKTIKIPEYYDLREHINVEVKNQMDTGECWAFTASTSLETYLALNGEIYNFSERHLDYATASNFIDGINEYALNRFVGAGGYNSTAFTYYSRGNGPILEEDMPFENNENAIRLADLPTNSAIKKVDDMIYFPNIYKYKNDSGELIYEDANGMEYTKTEITEIRNKVKEHIMNYGAISTSVYAPPNYYNEGTCSDNLCENVYSNHAVTIIGWDDNYNKENFINQPSEDGAYIVLNSWGTEWGDNGVYYVSYEDFLIESQMRGVTSVSDLEYDNLYQYDISEMWNYIESPYAANVFTAKANEKLTEIMIGSLSEQTCDIYINATSDDLNINDLTKIASNVKLNPGYNTIEIDSEIELISGNKFAIVVQLTNSDYTGIGIEDNEEVYFGNAKSNIGESFISEDGINWTDIYDKNNMMNFSIKAYTQTDEKEIEATNISGKAYEKFGGDFSFSIKTSYREKDKEVAIKFYDENGTELNNFKINGSKIRGNGTFIKIKCPKDLEAGTYYVDINLSSFGTITKTFNVLKMDDDKILLQFNDENFLQYMYTKTEDSFVSYDSLQLITSQESINNVIILEDAYMKKIKDITGIQYYKNINEINFNSNEITNIEELKNLTNLKKLKLSNNKVSDFSSISDLTNLEELVIAGCCKLENIDFLNKLNNLTVLDMKLCGSNEKIDIEKIFSLTKLEELDLSAWYWIDENDLKDIYKLENLKILALNGCNIGNINFLKNLYLEDLEIGNAQYWYPDGTLSEKGTNHFSDLIPLSEMYTLWSLDVSKVDELESLNGIENLTNLTCLWVEYGALRNANVLDSEVFNRFWSNLWLYGNQINDIIGKTEETIVEIDVPEIIKQACNNESLLYSESGVLLENCEWKEYGKTIKMDTSKFSSCYVCINSGYAMGTRYNVNINNNDTEKIYIQFPDINLYNAIKTKTPFGGYKIEFECFDDENKIYISKDDIKYITYLDLTNIDIEDITGIENFTNVQTINLGYNNNLENIDTLNLLPKIRCIILNSTKVQDIGNLINKDSVEEIRIYKENLKVYTNKEEKIELPKYIYQSLKLQEGVTAKAVIYYDVLDTTKGGGGEFPINDYNNFQNVDIYLDDEKEIATIELDRSITSKKKKGIRAILVTMEGGKTSNSEYMCYYEVTRELTSIKVEGYSSESYYFIEGQDFNRNGIKVVANYNDGTSQEITDYQVINGKNLKLTQKSVTISYTEDGITKTTAQEIMVKAKSLEKIEIKNIPNNTNYYVGDTLDIQGLVLIATYNNGDTEEITEGFEYMPTTLNTVGEQEITVNYKGKTAAFNVTVLEIQKEKLSVNLKNESKYEITTENEVLYIEKVSPKTTIRTVLDSIETNGEIKIYKGTNEVTDKAQNIATGMTIEITKGTEKKTYTIVVTGDTSGDGEANMRDIWQINKHRLGKVLLTGAKLKAGNVNGDEKVDIYDILKINKYRLGKDTL